MVAANAGTVRVKEASGVELGGRLSDAIGWSPLLPAQLLLELGGEREQQRLGVRRAEQLGADGQAVDEARPAR